MENHKKEVSGDIPFEFLNELGHNTRAMERYFSLPRQARETLSDAVAISSDPTERTAEALKSLAQGGEGYFEPY